MTAFKAAMSSPVKGRNKKIQIETKRLSSGLMDIDNAILIDNQVLGCIGGGSISRHRRGSSFSSSNETAASSTGGDDEILPMRASDIVEAENIGNLSSVLMVSHFVFAWSVIG